MKYLLFGTGEYYQRYKKWFAKDNIAALLDNSKDKQGTYIDGIKVYSPQEGIKLQYDAIVVLSFYIKEMKSQLLALGAEESRIYHFFDLHRLLGGKAFHMPVKYYGNAQNVINSTSLHNKKVLLMSHDLTLGGPALALYNAAETLKRNGYEVVFASMLDGLLRASIMDNDIPVIIDENLQIQTMNEAQWTRSFDFIICNTISYYVFLSERDKDMPFIWWLHDSPFFYDGVDKDILKGMDMRNLDIFSVGSVPADAIRQFIPNLTVNKLLYGVDDIKKADTAVKQDRTKVRFTTIGYIESRKGQDILISAVKNLSAELLDKCEFYLVGQNTSMLAKQIMEEVEGIPQVYITGCVDRDEIDRMLANTDILVCPSREDPMPTVVAEAMMHSVPCIISSAAGTAEYIQNGINGFVFESENADELLETIKWSIRGKEKLPQMGVQARKVYEKVFSMPAFERNLLKAVEERISKKE